MPPFTIFMGKEAEASVSLRYLNQARSENRTKYDIDAKLGEALVTGLMDHGFDPSYSKKTRYDGGLGHAFARVLKFLKPNADGRVLPVMVNTYYPPAPSAKRCLQFGQTLATLIREYPSDDRIVIAASGGLSHTKIDEPLDAKFLAALQANDTDYMSAMPSSVFREGTSEILNWIAVAGAANQSRQVNRLSSALSHQDRRRLRHGLRVLGFELNLLSTLKPSLINRSISFRRSRPSMS